MPTQQDKIREMANKKLLNGEQKKVLYKLFEAKINEKVSRVRDIFRTAEKDLDNRLLKQAKSNSEIKRLRALIKEYEVIKDKAEKDIEKMGFSLDCYNNDLNIGSNHPESRKLEANNRRKLDKMEDLKLKLLADIHGLPMTYDEMTSYISGELAKIEAE